MKHIRTISRTLPARAGFFSVIFTWIYSAINVFWDFLTGAGQLQPVGRDIEDMWQDWRNPDGK